MVWCTKKVVSTRSEKNTRTKWGGARSRGDFGHRRYIRCAGNRTWPLQFPFLLLAIALLLFCLNRCQDLQLLRDKVRRTRSVTHVLSLSETPKLPEQTETYRIRRIRMIISPLPTSFSSFFSRLRSLMVPRFRCEYTLFARFLIDGDARRVCCIMRTHSTISMSLG